MILTCLGHSKFLIELDNGMRIVTDPYDAACGYPVTEVEADCVLVSHGHHDHSAVETITGQKRIIDRPGVTTLESGVVVTAIEAFHDDCGGSKRGKTLLFLLEAEGLRVAHLGDLGHVLDAAQVADLAPVDLLLLPVGGFFTIDAKAAKTVAEQLRAKAILPMHYRTGFNADWPIAPVEEFTGLYPTGVEEADLLRVTKEDLPCLMQVAVLRPQAGKM